MRDRCEYCTPGGRASLTSYFGDIKVAVTLGGGKLTVSTLYSDEEREVLIHYCPNCGAPLTTPK